MTSPSPSPTATETAPSPSPTATEPASTTVVCDAGQALYDVGDGSGCHMLIAPAPFGDTGYDVRLDQEWIEPAVFFAIIVVVCLAAIVVAQFRKG